MAEDSNLPLLDHELADDELNWIKAVHRDFTAARAGLAGQENGTNLKQTLREVVGRKEHLLANPMELSGDGPWRLGKNNHDRSVACVFLKKIELHKHAKSRTDQFAMYVVGEADAFSLNDKSQPILTAVESGSHFHNSPGAPHAFLPKVGQKTNDDWEIAFIAITPRNLKEDTQKVSEETKAAYKQVVGYDAPLGL
ncbi:hypothetical protein [Acidisphaera sp. S103]|uniref:hypothetical protein n=1 Tax=Acidisphaera sp. S103 TaxID=1747223 RepID=UPI00131E7CB1|nr:hypothetical protein [Acidisphaera sp. S103]